MSTSIQKTLEAFDKSFDEIFNEKGDRDESSLRYFFQEFLSQALKDQHEADVQEIERIKLEIAHDIADLHDRNNEAADILKKHFNSLKDLLASLDETKE